MLETLVGIFGAAFLGAIGWAVQISSRISTIETKHPSLIELIETRFDAVDQRLDRIERGMNGHLPKD